MDDESGKSMKEDEVKTVGKEESEMAWLRQPGRTGSWLQKPGEQAMCESVPERKLFLATGIRKFQTRLSVHCLLLVSVTLGSPSVCQSQAEVL